MNEGLRYLQTLPRFDQQGGLALKPGLERIEALLERMGRPHDAYPSIHVGGTNGKGSTASMVAAIASAAGLRTGLHMTPFLRDIGEMMRVDGRPADPLWIGETVAAHLEAFQAVGPSFFEASVALSLAYFADRGVDLAVVEVGLGGRLDATNILLPQAAVVTNVGLEHQQFLGDTLEAIAAEKAGIIKPGVPVITTAQPAVIDIIRRTAAERDAPLHWIDDEVAVQEQDLALDGSTLRVETPLRTYDPLFVGLGGRHQIRNALAALRAAELVIGPVRDSGSAVTLGLREVRERTGLRGRLEVVRTEPLVIADVGHNAEGLAAVLGHLRGRVSGRLTVLFGVMRDKDVATMSRLLARAAARVHPVHLEAERALSAGELAQMLDVGGVDVAESCTVEAGIHAFLLDAAPSDALLLTGSHLVVAQMTRAA